MNQTIEALPDLYEADETAWLETTAALIAGGKYEEIDFVHLQEYLTDMAKRDKREVESRLVVLIMHVLKWTHQKKKRTKSWRRTIVNEGRELRGIFDSRVLKKHATKVLSKVYREAVKLAAIETGLPASDFPQECPYSVDALLADDLHEQ